MKNQFTKITRDRLQECLEKIGWTTRHCGCNIYRIYNQYGNKTIFEFRAEHGDRPIYELNSRGGFGDGNPDGENGCVCFVLKGCHLVFDKQAGAVSIVANKSKDVSQPAFVSFYNFDIEKT